MWESLRFTQSAVLQEENMLGEFFGKQLKLYSTLFCIHPLNAERE